MKRRDTETRHEYADLLFRQLGIYDLQGMLHEGGSFSCGLECYQVNMLAEADISSLNPAMELARYGLCRALGVPYHIVICSTGESIFRVFLAELVNGRVLNAGQTDMSPDTFVRWWRERQSFTQRKPMYEASARIQDSYVDRLLFTNSLAWGVNVDGFLFDFAGMRVRGIIEKRITSKYTVSTYDPNRFFHGSSTKSGDYPSWVLVKALADALGVPLFLMTFDRQGYLECGLARITDINTGGISYENSRTPAMNIFRNDPEGVRNWIAARVQS